MEEQKQIRKKYQKETMIIGSGFPDAGFGRWSREQNQTMIKDLLEWPAIKLELSHNHRPQLITEIQHINFPKLKHLILRENCLISLEALTPIHMPHLCEFSVANNLLISLKEMKKFHWPELIEVYLDDNFVLSGESLTEADFPSLSCIWVYGKCLRHRQFQDFRFILKLQAEKLNSIQTHRSRLVKQPYLQEKIKGKFPNMGLTFK